MQTAETTQEPGAVQGIEVPQRSPVRAGLYSTLLPGMGQVYNKQLEKAVLLWIWAAIIGGTGLMLVLLGVLGTAVPRTAVRPPLGDWIADHAAGVFIAWMLAAGTLWALSLRDAWISAERINRREVVIRYPLRRQLVHVLASQLLGFIPLIGLLFPPGVVAEAMDSLRERRGPDRQRLVREGGQALLEWALTRLAFYALWALLGLWILWWVLRIAGLPV
jgi:uncharacterized protein DUF5683